MKQTATKKSARKTTEKLPPLPEISTFPTIKKGSKETGCITLLQTNLKDRGYYDGKVDGKFGDKTEQAVKDFQKDLGKPISGSVGPKTWEQITKSTIVKAKPQPQTPAPASEPKPEISHNCRVLIEGLSRYQADLLVKILQGHTECRIL